MFYNLGGQTGRIMDALGISLILELKDLRSYFLVNTILTKFVFTKLIYRAHINSFAVRPHFH